MAETQRRRTTQLSLDAFLNRAIGFPYVRDHHIRIALQGMRKTKADVKVDKKDMSMEEKKAIVDLLRTGYGCGVDDDEEIFLLMEEEDKTINHVVPDLPRPDELCPPPGVECRSKDFDDLKVFYHLDNSSLSPQGNYTFYIGRRGCRPYECIDWYSEGIRVDVKGSDGEWEDCRHLKVPGGTHARVHYKYKGKKRIFDLHFPYPSPKELAQVFPAQYQSSTPELSLRMFRFR